MYPTIPEWISSLPQLKKDEFLILIDDTKVFCVKELNWYDSMLIDCMSFREKSDGTKFYAGEHQRRETLCQALIWAAEWIDEDEQNIEYNTDEELINKIDIQTLNKVSQSYTELTELTIEEAKFLKDSAEAYFEGTAQEAGRIHPLVIEVDMCLKFGSFSRDEIRNISTSDMAKIQLILATRESIVGNNISLGQQIGNSGGKKPEKAYLGNMTQEEFQRTLPPHMRGKV